MTVLDSERTGATRAATSSPDVMDMGSVEHRPSDLARVIACAVLAAASGVWAQAGGTFDVALTSVLNGLGSWLEGTARLVSYFGTIWMALAVVVLMLVLRRARVALAVGAASTLAWAIAALLHEVLGSRSASQLGIVARVGHGPIFPMMTVAVASALVASLAPYVVRPLRRLGWSIVVLIGSAGLYLGTGLVGDALGGWFIGVGAGALVLYVLGSPGGTPTASALVDALGTLGFSVRSVRPSALAVRRGLAVDVTLEDGSVVHADVFGRDQRDAQLAARIWHSAMYREPGSPAFGSRMQHVEHVGYALLVAERAGAHVPTLLKTGIAGPNAALLVTADRLGVPLSELDADALVPQLLGEVWLQATTLHSAGVAHGALDVSNVLVKDDRVTLANLHDATVGADPYRTNRDVAALLVSTALIVGNYQAISAAMAAVGKDVLAAVLPILQPAALPPATQHSLRHHKKFLKVLRSDLASEVGVEDVQLLHIRRLTATNIAMLAGIGIALAIAIPQLQGIDDLAGTFSDAIWGWIVLAALMYPLILVAWATALMGAVNADIPFVPTVLTQLASTFLNFVTPNGIGGTALQVDYLHREGVPVASTASAVVLNSAIGGAMQLLLFGLAILITGVGFHPSGETSSLGSTILWAIAIVAALIGIVLLVPKLRGKVVPAVNRALSDLWAVVRNPHKAMQLLGGNLAGNLLYPAVLGVCLLAFGVRLDFAALVAVQIGAGILGNIAPVPGGMGVQEAALTAGLSAFGVPSAPALAAVIAFRGITFVAPPVFGWFALGWLRRSGYA